MPTWLESVLTIIAIYAILFFLNWAVSRKKKRQQLSLRARILGWTAVLVTIGGLMWSFWVESFSYYFSRGAWPGALMTLLQFFLLISGAALIVYGGVTYLKHLFGWMETSYMNLLGEMQLEGSRRQRFRLLGKMLRIMSTLPGMDWLLMGLGIAIANNLVPDPGIDMAPDVRTYGGWAGGLFCLGLLVHFLRPKQ